jgi:hypothetical protein
MFHNDTDNPASFKFLADLGIHVFNFTHLQSLAKVRELVGPEVCLLGNVPPLETPPPTAVIFINWWFPATRRDECSARAPANRSTASPSSL